MDDKTYFGFKKINRDEKNSLVKEVFSGVAGNYDLMNNFMSLGIHHLWKRIMISKLNNVNGSLIDVAGGTGDIASLYIKRARLRHYHPHVLLYDINPDMLNIGKDKLINQNILDADYICGNAEIMPVTDNNFDYYTIAYGIRNITNIAKALKEAHRILKPGGKFVCLEFLHVENKMLSLLYDFYSFNIIPTIGKYVAKNEEAYSYLVESIRKFPSQLEFLSMIENVGFRRCGYENLTGGISAIFYGYKI